MNLSFLKDEMIGKGVPKPISGTLSGHAAGEPFDKHVESLLHSKFPNGIKRQFTYLNELFAQNPSCTTFEDRKNLISSEVARFLLLRGKESVSNWRINKPFEEKQNDTADILLVDAVPAKKFQIIDVKTTNTAKQGQPPNIISAEKLAKACAKMIDTNDFDTVKITYIGVNWELNRNLLLCTDVAIKELFKTNPSELYINWVAAQQIQFKVDDLSQEFNGNTSDWCRQYIERYIKSCKDYAEKKIKKLETYEQYIK